MYKYKNLCNSYIYTYHITKKTSLLTISRSISNILKVFSFPYSCRFLRVIANELAEHNENVQGCEALESVYTAFIAERIYPSSFLQFTSLVSPSCTPPRLKIHLADILYTFMIRLALCLQSSKPYCQFNNFSR